MFLFPPKQNIHGIFYSSRLSSFTIAPLLTIFLKHALRVRSSDPIVMAFWCDETVQPMIPATWEPRCALATGVHPAESLDLQHSKLIFNSCTRCRNFSQRGSQYILVTDLQIMIRIDVLFNLVSAPWMKGFHRFQHLVIADCELSIVIYGVCVFLRQFIPNVHLL